MSLGVDKDSTLSTLLPEALILVASVREIRHSSSGFWRQVAVVGPLLNPAHMLHVVTCHSREVQVWT